MMHVKQFKLYFVYSFVLFFCRHCVIPIIFTLFSSDIFAITSFIIKDIRVEGMQRIELETIFNYLPVHIGDIFTNKQSIAVIKELYATGLFEDIQIQTKDNVLIVQVEERPAIGGINFTGMKEFNKNQLSKILKDIGISESRIFSKYKVVRAEQELKRQYLSRGFYGIKIISIVTSAGRDRMIIQFDINEGNISHIRHIDFAGNTIFSDIVLRNQLTLTTTNWITWYTKTDRFSEKKLTDDLKILRSYYLDRGYLEMQIKSTKVLITPDSKNINIIINIYEGEKFAVSAIKLNGEMFGIQNDLAALIEFKKNDIYSEIKFTKTLIKINERLGNFGYAFASINVNKNIDREKKIVTFIITINPGRRTYVRHINIIGNNMTRDEIIRREFHQFENSWYDGKIIKLSRDRIEKLDYFNEVYIQTLPIHNSNDQVDINIKVEEKKTGNIIFGAGFSQQDKLSLTGSLSEKNVFGSGNTVDLDINTSLLYRTMGISQTNPYFTDDGISLTYMLFLRTIRPPAFKIGNYQIRTIGSNIKFGIPFSEVDKIFLSVGIENVTVNTDNTSPILYRTYIRDFNNKTYCDVINNDQCGIGPKTAISIPIITAWQRDKRDNMLIPTKGQFQRFNLEISAIGALRYYRATYQYQYFQPLWSTKVTLAINNEINYGKGFNNKSYPIFKNFYAGGIGSVRGYEDTSLGNLRDQYGDSMGGSASIINNLEIQFLFPGMNQDPSLHWFTFIDSGNVFSSYKDIKFNELRYSAGIGISWISPIGPLKLSYGKPLNLKSSDKLKNFQFQVGTGF